MKFGVHLSLWTSRWDEDITPYIDRVQRLGFDGVEITVMLHQHLDLLRIRRLVEERGLGLTTTTGLPADADIVHPDPAMRRRGVEFLKSCIDAAAKLGSQMLSGVLYRAWGQKTGRPRTESEWEQCVNGLRQAAKYAAQVGVPLAIEPINRYETYFLNTAADAVRLVEAVGESSLGVLLDVFHMNMEEKSLPGAIAATGRHLFHVQVAENDRGTPGTGHVDWPGVFKVLRRVGYHRWVSIESFRAGVQSSGDVSIWRELAPPDELAGQGLRFLRSVAG